MSSQLTAQSITQEDISSILDRYASLVPAQLKELDEIRFNTVPATLAERNSNGDAYLSKSELESLVQWKIKHGKFRPTLPKLVASNEAKIVKDITRKAFGEYSSNPAAPEKAVKILNELKGIGPATSSLVLSVYDPSSAPFFSDELFRYLAWDLPGSPSGWERKIKYDMKELSQFYSDVKPLIDRLRGGDKVKATDLEKVAYVLGKEKIDLSKRSDSDVAEPKPLISSKRKRDETALIKKPPKRGKQ